MPGFDCSAVFDHEVVEFNWNKVHERRTLVFQLDSIDNDTAVPGGPVAMTHSVGDFKRLQANVAVVCRDHVFEILEWASRSADEEGPAGISFPIIRDSEERIASMYDRLDADGCSLWGRSSSIRSEEFDRSR